MSAARSSETCSSQRRIAPITRNDASAGTTTEVSAVLMRTLEPPTR